MDKSKSPSFLNLIFTVAGLLIVLVYGGVALNTGDPLWISPIFSEVPREILVICYGDQRTLTPQDPEFQGLTEIVNQTLSSEKNYDPLTMGEQTYIEYRESTTMMVLELFYPSPVRIHSFYKFFSNLDSIVIPLDGRHAATYAIFGRLNDFSTAGSLHFNEMPQVRMYIENQGICLKP